MMVMLARLATLWALLGSSLVHAQDRAVFPGVEHLMSTTEQSQTGIDQLSPEQTAALNAWFERYLREDAPAPAEAPAQTASTIVTQSADRAVEIIRSRITGEFSGWEGNTRFVLENGQVWEQRRPGRHRVRLTAPEVTIQRNRFNAWELELVEDGASIGVRRVR